MSKGPIRQASSVSNRVTVLVILAGLVAASGVALLLTRSGSDVVTDAAAQPRAARTDGVDGSVAIASFDEAIDENEQLDWTEATLNTPVYAGDRIYARDNSHASIALTGHNYVRLNPGASLDVLSLPDPGTRLALRSGSALFDVGALESDEFYEVATPGGAVDFLQPGLYQIGIDGGSTLISVLAGLAQVAGLAGSETIGQGEVLTLVSATAAQALVSTLAPSLAGGIVDDYYRDRYGSVYDGRYESYDRYLDDPFYYDPYRSSVSCEYFPADVPGIYDLDYYGDWLEVGGYGYCWAPRVSSGWAPFRHGYWDLDPFWGPTWVSYEPWGWAPYHYGRWTFVDQRWFWVPAEVVSRPVYCPATVAFVPLVETSQIAWVPLAPGEQYVPRYYDGGFNPRYLATPDSIKQDKVEIALANLNAPSAVTAVYAKSFSRVINRDAIVQVDPRVVASNQPTPDPFSIDSVRQLARARRDGRRRLRLARVERDSLNTPVVINAKRSTAMAGADTSRKRNVDRVTDTRSDHKLKIDRGGQVTNTQQLRQPPLAGEPERRRLRRFRRQQSQQQAPPFPQKARRQAQPQRAPKPQNERPLLHWTPKRQNERPQLQWTPKGQNQRRRPRQDATQQLLRAQQLRQNQVKGMTHLGIKRAEQNLSRAQAGRQHLKAQKRIDQQWQSNENRRLPDPRPQQTIRAMPHQGSTKSQRQRINQAPQTRPQFTQPPRMNKMRGDHRAHKMQRHPSL